MRVWNWLWEVERDFVPSGMVRSCNSGSGTFQKTGRNCKYSDGRDFGNETQ